MKVMEKGEITYNLPALDEIRAAAEKNLTKLPAKYKRLTNPPEYSVDLSPALESLIRKLKRKLTKTEIKPAKA